jgi:hypothetical protein
VFSNVPALGRHKSLGNAIIPELNRKNRLPKRAGGAKTTLTGQAGTKIPGKISQSTLDVMEDREKEKCRGASLRGQGTPAHPCPPPQ